MSTGPATLQLFKCMNPECGLTSTLSVMVHPRTFALSGACIHCHTLHQVVRNPDGGPQALFSVNGLLAPR